MRVISQSPFFYNRVLPWLWAGAVAGWVALLLIGRSVVFMRMDGTWFVAVMLALIFAAVFFSAVVFFFFPKRIKFADEVRDAGDALIVRQSGQEARIALADIAGVQTQRYPIPQGAFYVVLTLRAPCAFGDKVWFLPIDERTFLSGDIGLAETFSAWQLQVVKELMARINAARP